MLSRRICVRRQPMPITTEVTEDGIGIVRVVGEVVYYPDGNVIPDGPTSTDELRKELDGLIDEHQVADIVIDLRLATYVAPRGFGQMLVVLFRCRTRRGDMVVSGAEGSVWSAASTVGLDNVIDFYSDEEAAIAKLTEDGVKCA